MDDMKSFVKIQRCELLSILEELDWIKVRLEQKSDEEQGRKIRDYGKRMTEWAHLPFWKRWFTPQPAMPGSASG